METDKTTRETIKIIDCFNFSTNKGACTMINLSGFNSIFLLIVISILDFDSKQIFGRNFDYFIVLFRVRA